MALPANHPNVVGRPLTRPSMDRQLGILTKQGQTLRPAAAMFHEHLYAALKSNRFKSKMPSLQT
jgi:hypothetical protein